MANDKKQRQKAKREAKRKELRRRNSISPIKRLADAPGELECWMSDGLEIKGRAQAFVYKQGGGQTGVACFLVDRGVVGLKDAWTRLEMNRTELKSMIDGAADAGIPMTRVTPDAVRRLIAGAVRWTRQNGMRLPADYVKTVAVLGGAGDTDSADVSAFALEFAGHPDDLRSRLIGEPFDDYIKRSDVHFMFNDLPRDYGRLQDRDDHDDEENGDGLDVTSLAAEVLETANFELLLQRHVPAANGLATDTLEWLLKKGEAGSTELFEAWQSLMLGAMISKIAMPAASDKETAELGFEIVRESSRRIESARFEEYDRSVGQALNHLLTDPKMMEKAVLKYGLADVPTTTE